MMYFVLRLLSLCNVIIVVWQCNYGLITIIYINEYSTNCGDAPVKLLRCGTALYTKKDCNPLRIAVFLNA